MTWGRSWLLSTLAATAIAGGCGDDEAASGAGGGGQGAAGAGAPLGGGGQSAEGGSGGAPPIAPGPAFDRFCAGEAWDTELSPAVEGELTGEYAGIISEPLPEGTLDSMKIVPKHPLHVRKLRIAFGGDPGTVRVRLMTTFGRSYPGGWPDYEAESANLIVPIDLDVTAPDPEVPVEIDIASQGVFLEPTQHYVVIVEHLGPTPQVAIESLTGDPSRALIHVPGEDVPYGLDGNFRMELVGDHFCTWTEAERWFGEHTDAPFSAETSGYVQVVDLDGDGHDDVIVQAPGPKAFFGDGTGSFTAAGIDPFADVPLASLVVFADVDGDGDRDAFAGHYVGANNDGDTYTLAEGDCNDADPAVRPNAVEVMNGYDDDCDGIADDGTDTSDADADGTAIVAGDCDDTRPEVLPGAEELLDGLDNDCDGEVDEDFVDQILLNDGFGAFTPLAASGVEGIDPTTTATFADTDGDGNLDLYWGNWLEHYPDFPAVPDRFAVGFGDGTFLDQSVEAGILVMPERPCYGAGFWDYNDDGLPDLYVGNYQLSDNNLFENQGDGTFVDVAPQKSFNHDDIPTELAQYPGGHSYGAAFGDVDTDGDIDAFVSNLSHPRTQPWADPSQFYFNEGAPDYSFVDRRAELGIVYDEGDVNAAFADWDNDGDLDLAVAALYPTHYAKLYRNDGPDGFVDVTYEAGIEVHLAVGLAFSDVDEDGDLDLLAAEGIGPDFVHYYENRIGQDSSWIELELEGTLSNRDAIGARVTVVAGGVTRIRDVEAGGGHHLQHSHVVHFGLGSAESLDSISIRWPSGNTETISAADVRARWRVVEGEGVATPF
ncbi:MAG: hypothetical protein HOV80_24555 [Polyangiaceae bacterium]|nr:hypothetical protein [Polyangiaceae bacterium]